MANSYLRELIHQGAVVTGPVRPANSGDRAAIRAHLRDQRAARRAR
jgi:hypothetical protein